MMNDILNIVLEKGNIVSKNDCFNPDEKMNMFKLPIEYIDNKTKLEDHTINDLELVKSENKKSLYTHVFNPNTIMGENNINRWSKYYTSDISFLKDTQTLLKKKNIQQDNVNAECQTDIIEIWNEINNETGFNEKYSYVEWEKLRILNTNSKFLQLLSMYNMASPIFSLMMPILFLIIPLIIIKIRGLPITIDKYIELLKMVFKKHQLGKIFDISTLSFEKMVYVFASIIFYFIQIYQNIMTCRNFFYNMEKIHKQIFSLKEYLYGTIKNFDILQEQCSDLPTYNTFIENMQEHRIVCVNMLNDLKCILPNKITFNKTKQIGHVMKCFYKIYKDPNFHKTFEYTFGVNGYIDNLNGLRFNIKNKYVSSCKFKKGITTFNNAYFPSLVKENPVKNSYKLNKNLIITGPNAAGKTTLLKTTIFNIIMSQQLGFGFYKKANIVPYDMIHCYINIPDTSERDSLFQAEAKRCKDILDHICNNKKSTSINNDNDNNDNNDNSNDKIIDKKLRHFCVFDELYSGTNPYEAISSANAFLKYLHKYDSVNFVLTTHFLDLCKGLDDIDKIDNLHMNINTENNNFIYTYKLKKGISEIKGGVKVLKDLNYPSEIIENAITMLNE